MYPVRPCESNSCPPERVSTRVPELPQLTVRLLRSVSTSRLPDVVVTFVIVITNVPGNVGVHPGGAAAVGVMSAVIA